MRSPAHLTVTQRAALSALHYEWNDTHEAMTLALADGRWTQVAKYAAQLADIEGRIARASRVEVGEAVWS